MWSATTVNGRLTSVGDLGTNSSERNSERRITYKPKTIRKANKNWWQKFCLRSRCGSGRGRSGGAGSPAGTGPISQRGGRPRRWLQASSYGSTLTSMMCVDDGNWRSVVSCFFDSGCFLLSLGQYLFSSYSYRIVVCSPDKDHVPRRTM